MKLLVEDALPGGRLSHRHSVRFVSLAAALLLVLVTPAALPAERLRVAFGEIDITPALDGRPVWIAGYGQNRRATGVHDPLQARGIVLDDGVRRFALVSVDLIGLQYPAVQKIRSRLPGFDYVLVSSTHNHEGPDVIGLWGPGPFKSGVDRDYVAFVVERVAAMLAKLAAELQPARAFYGTADDETLLGDSRLPKVYDPVLRAVRFEHVDDRRPLGLLVQWNCHPEALGPKNSLITADFPHATVAALARAHRCPVAYFTGPVGGLMAPPDNRVHSAEGELLREGDFEYARVYGEMVAELANRALERAEPLELVPLAAFARPIAVPLANPLYQAARLLGVIEREGRVWTGDFDEPGARLAQPVAGEPVAVETEVAYLRLGELHVACIPGELYPELVYGKFQEPVEPNVDYPDARLEKPVMAILPGEKVLVLGLANDELGYIIPKRQWDQAAPFAYGRKKAQYGEINSCGPEVAHILMQALERRVEEAGSGK